MYLFNQSITLILMSYLPKIESLIASHFTSGYNNINMLNIPIFASKIDMYRFLLRLSQSVTQCV